MATKIKEILDLVPQDSVLVSSWLSSRGIDRKEQSQYVRSGWLERLARGVQDILIACVDGLKGFPDAIASVFPQTTVQLCIVHQIRNSVKYVASKNRKEFMRDQKLVYQAVNKDAAEKALDDLEIKAYLHLILLLKSLSISHLRESGRNGRSRCRTGDRRPSNWHPKAVIAIFNKFPQAVNR